MFGFDNGLTADIDAKQYAYFASLADKLPADAKIVVVTHDPNWVLDNYEGAPQHRRYLDALLSRSTIKSKLRLRLAGDIHNYMRHTSKSGGPTLIVSGGGGAFLHPTHCAKLGREPLSYQGKTYEQNQAFPSCEMSRRMGYANMWKFRKRNLLFDFVGGLLYIGLAYPVLTRCWSDELVLAFNTPSKSFVCGSANELSEACLWWRVCGGLVFESLVEIPKVTLHLIRNELLFDNFMGLAMMWLIAYVRGVCSSAKRENFYRVSISRYHENNTNLYYKKITGTPTLECTLECNENSDTNDRTQVLVDTHKTGLKLVVGTWCSSACVRVRVFECEAREYHL